MKVIQSKIRMAYLWNQAILFFYCLSILSVQSQDNDEFIRKIKFIYEPESMDSTTQITEVHSLTRINIPEDCQCLWYYQCKNDTIIEDGANLIEYKYLENPCTEKLHRCCKKANQVPNAVPPTPSPNYKFTECGYRNPSGMVFKIVDAQNGEAQFGEFPWMVALLNKSSSDSQLSITNMYKCGGSLIHPSVILTAAHCIDDPYSQFIVRAGEWDLTHNNEPYPFQDREISSIKIHPNFSRLNSFNNIALLFLAEPFKPAPHIGFICLPPQSLLPRGRGYAMGWGKRTKVGKDVDILKKIDLPVVPKDSCTEKLRKTRLGPYFNLHSSLICAGGETKDTYHGDGGSSFILPVTGCSKRYYQAGIVAWGIDCGYNNTPGVYVNVARFRYWIDTQMKSRSYGSETYSYTIN